MSVTHGARVIRRRAWISGLLLSFGALGSPLGAVARAAEIDWSDPIQETAAAMRVGLYLGDLRACAWNRLPVFKPYGALSVDDLRAGIDRLLPEEQAKDPGVARTVRQGFIMTTRTKRLLDAETCADLAATVREDLGVDPRDQ